MNKTIVKLVLRASLLPFLLALLTVSCLLSNDHNEWSIGIAVCIIILVFTLSYELVDGGKGYRHIWRDRPLKYKATTRDGKILIYRFGGGEKPISVGRPYDPIEELELAIEYMDNLRIKGANRQIHKAKTNKALKHGVKLVNKER